MQKSTKKKVILHIYIHIRFLKWIPKRRSPQFPLRIYYSQRSLRKYSQNIGHLSLFYKNIPTLIRAKIASVKSIQFDHVKVHQNKNEMQHNEINLETNISKNSTNQQQDVKKHTRLLNISTQFYSLTYLLHYLCHFILHQILFIPYRANKNQYIEHHQAIH